MRLRNRISLTFTLITLALLGLAFVALYFFTHRNTEREFFHRLEERALIAAQTSFAEDELGQKVFEEVVKLHFKTLPEEKEYFVRLDSGEVDFDSLPEFITRDLLGRINRTGLAHIHTGDRLGAGINYVDNEGIFAVIITAKDQYGEQKLENLRKLMGLILVTYFLLVFFIGRVYAHHMLNPIRRMIRKIREINTNNLHLRLEEKARADGRGELSELAKTFNQMLDRIETSVEAQSHFIGNASHQLKNPLTAILGEVETGLAQDRTVGQYHQSLLRIEEEAGRLKELILQLLHLAHTGDHREGNDFAECRIDELILELVDEYRALKSGKVLRVDFSTFPEDPCLLQVNIHRNLIKIALANIIENSFKFSSDQEVNLSLSANAKEVEITISDKGIGIPRNSLPNIFDPFFRADNAYQYPGFGIGLPMVRRIINLHEGEVRAESELGEGATFFIRIPR